MPELAVGCCSVLRSIFEVHNETINIWTHLITGAGWASVGLDALGHESLSPMDQACIFFVVIMGGAMFVCSILAHLCSCLSERANLWWWRVDYCGILSLWFGRLVFDSYFILAKCHPFLFQLSLVCSILVFSVAVPSIVFHRTTAHFIGVFAYIHLPLLYLATGMADQPANQHTANYLYYNMWAFVCAIVGFSFFSSRLPEVMFPGVFDIWGHSHQWWHIFVGVGPILSLVAGGHLVENSFELACPADPAANAAFS